MLRIDFEGGFVTTEDIEGAYLVHINQIALLDLLDPEDRDGIEGITTHSFSTRAERDDYLRSRGWVRAP